MTWVEYIEAKANELAEADSDSEADKILATIVADLAVNRVVPANFWDRLHAAYRRAPKPLLKEAAAAAALNALQTYVDKLLAARAAGTRP